MKKVIAQKSANWWTNLIKVSYPDLSLKVLERFKTALINEILNSGLMHSIFISSYGMPNGILERACYASMLPVEIPRGFEMRILMDTVSVYNDSGILVNTL